MNTVNSTGSKAIYSSSGKKQFTPYNIAEDAPISQYTVPKYGYNTWSINDTEGTPWYLTSGGKWRNTKTNAISPTHPTYAPVTPAPAPAGPTTTPPPAETAPNTFKSIWDFTRTSDQERFRPQTFSPSSINTAPQTFQPLQLQSQPQDQVFSDQSLYSPQAAPQFKSFMDFFPKQQGESAAYRYAIDRGNQELSKNLSAMGLLGSGAELQKRQDLNQAALSDEVDRLMQSAAADYQAYNTGQQMAFEDRSNVRGQALADRQLSRQFDFQNQFDLRNLAAQDAAAVRNLQYQDQDTVRQLGAQDQASVRDLLSSIATADMQRYYDNYNQDADRQINKDAQGLSSIGMTLDFLKSLNPLQYGFPATNTQSQNYIDLGKQLSALMASTGGGGGGGGGGGSSPVLPDKPGGFNSTNYWLQTGASLLPSIIKAFK